MSTELDSAQIFTLLNSLRRLDQLMPTLLDIILDLTKADRGFLMLYDRNGEFVIRAARDSTKADLTPDQFQGSTSVIRKVTQEKKPVYVPVIPADKNFSSAPSVRAINLQSVICLPFWRSQPDPASILGLLYIDSFSQVPAPLGEEKLRFLESIANHVAISIENAQLFEELDERNREIDSLNRKLQEKVELQEGRLVEMNILLEDTQRELGKRFGLGNIVGKSAAIQKVFRILEKVVRTDATVLIQGESGTGKELIAKYIHYNGARASKPLISINCAAFNDDLLESEMFGHRKGAFTGADQNKIGVFQLADHGTLFLDEIGEMSGEMQKKLLRVLQDGEVRPVGSKETFHVDVRILAAGNRDLRELAGKGKFREDLFYRLSVIQVDLPPLRDRMEDIPLLIEFFTGRIAEELKRQLPEPSQQTIKQFQEYSWPGNVRELENELRRFHILDSEYRFHPNRTASAPETLDLNTLEKNTILKALDATGGNKVRAAELLGIPVRTLYEKLKRYQA